MFSNIYFLPTLKFKNENYLLKKYKDDKLGFTQMPIDLTVNEGANAKFTCRNNEPKNTKISWLKNGELIKESKHYLINSNGDLEIKSIQVDDDAFYVCSIKNGDKTR